MLFSVMKIYFVKRLIFASRVVQAFADFPRGMQMLNVVFEGGVAGKFFQISTLK